MSATILSEATNTTSAAVEIIRGPQRVFMGFFDATIPAVAIHAAVAMEADDAEWEALFTQKSDVLDRLALAARAEHVAGKTRPIRLEDL